ncbi:MAG: hypothetical protein JXQ29_10460 [Planctomycetes bacterium]|nr:hypothetical protein [Planctomycetota bacterium]
MKRARFLFLLFAAIAAAPLAAQTVYVPDSGFTNSGNVIPMAGAWPASTNPGGEWTYQEHITATAIGRSGMIVGLAFLSHSNQTMTATLGRIRMSHTTLTTPSTTFATNTPCAVEVYPAQPLTWVGTAQAWSPLPMTRGFYYDGVRNLTIELRFQGAAVTGGNGACDTNSSHANAPHRLWVYGTGAYTATTAASAGDKYGLKVALVFADQAYCPSDTPTTGTANIFPMGWGAEGRFQMIVDAKYLPSAPVKITDIAFAPTAPTTFTASQFQMRMAHTTLADFSSSANFDTNLGSSPIIVHNGPMSWSATANAWSPFNLKGSFGYDGKRHLLIELRYTGGANGCAIYRDNVSPRLYTYGTGTYGATTGTGTGINGPKVRLTLDGRCYLAVGDTMRLGSKNAISLLDFPVGQFYQVGASLGQVPLGLAGYTVWLAPDSVLFASLSVGPPVFSNYGGVTSICGTGQAVLIIPSIPSLVGIPVYHAAIAYTNRGIVGATNTGGSLITR